MTSVHEACACAPVPPPWGLPPQHPSTEPQRLSTALEAQAASFTVCQEEDSMRKAPDEIIMSHRHLHSHHHHHPHHRHHHHPTTLEGLDKVHPASLLWPPWSGRPVAAAPGVAALEWPSLEWLLGCCCSSPGIRPQPAVPTAWPCGLRAFGSTWDYAEAGGSTSPPQGANLPHKASMVPRCPAPAWHGVGQPPRPFLPHSDSMADSA